MIKDKSLSQLGLTQEKTILRAKAFLNEKKLYDNISESLKYFLTCWHDGLGYLNLKKILKKNISIYEKFITYLKLIYSFSSIKDVQISQNLKKNKYENLVISHLNKSNYTPKKNYFDKHFSLNTNNTKSTIWIFITSSQSSKREKVINNIVLFKKIYGSSYEKILFFSKFLFKYILSFKFISPIKNIENYIDNSTIDKKLIDLVDDLILKKNIKNVVIPFEGHPLQYKILRNIKQNNPKVKSIGYMHSVLPALPTDYFKKNKDLDKLFVNGSVQKKILCNKLGWKKYDVKHIPSMRYIAEDKKDFQNQIFLPYFLKDERKIFQLFKNFISRLPKDHFPKLKVRNHPFMQNSRKHIKLKNLIDNFIDNNVNKVFKNHNKKRISVFIGSTASIIECLERNISAIHICSDEILDLYHPRFWKPLRVKKLSECVFEYHLSEKGKLIKIGKTNLGFKKLGINIY
jgi:hypothetical protein